MFYSALVVQQSRTSDGAYKIGQVEDSDSVSTLFGQASKHRVPFNSAVDIFTVSGSINTQTHETELALGVYGMNLGIFHGVPGQSFKINIDLSMVKGTIELRMNGFDELWLDINTQNFQIAPEGPGKFIQCKKAHFIRNMPDLRCAPWVSSEAHL